MEKQVKATFSLDRDMLRNAYKEMHDEPAGDDFDVVSTFSTEMGWVRDSGIYLGDYELTEDGEGVIATIIVDEDILREVFLEDHSDEEYSFSDAFSTEMGWVEESGIGMDEYTEIAC